MSVKLLCYHCLMSMRTARSSVCLESQYDLSRRSPSIFEPVGKHFSFTPQRTIYGEGTSTIILLGLVESEMSMSWAQAARAEGCSGPTLAHETVLGSVRQTGFLLSV